MNTGPERKTAAARAVCAGLTATTSRTRTLVSTATTPSLYALADRPFHVRYRTSSPAIAGATDDIVEARDWKRTHGSQQNAFGHALDDELSPLHPGVRFA